MPLDDPEVYKLFSRGQTEGIFQFESSGMKQMLMNLKPTKLEHLIAANSLYRPGPAKQIDTFVENSHHPEKVRYSVPQLKPILDDTFGCIVYQEQVMQILRSLAGYSYGRADVVRRAMSKKKKMSWRRSVKTSLKAVRKTIYLQILQTQFLTRLQSSPNTLSINPMPHVMRLWRTEQHILNAIIPPSLWRLFSLLFSIRQIKLQDISLRVKGWDCGLQCLMSTHL